MFVSKWFMSLYVAELRERLVMKIWASFLRYGWVAVWATGLALLSLFQGLS
jgi:hypothetical protein